MYVCARALSTPNCEAITTDITDDAQGEWIPIYIQWPIRSLRASPHCICSCLSGTDDSPTDRRRRKRKRGQQEKESVAARLKHQAAALGMESNQSSETGHTHSQPPHSTERYVCNVIAHCAMWPVVVLCTCVQ